jgi:F1F0 ATPase subunit 2
MSTLVPHGGLVAIATLGACGVLFGRCYFAALRWSVARHVAGHSSALQGLALAAIRVLCAAALFALAARLGALALLTAFLGFIAARSWALRGARTST